MKIEVLRRYKGANCVIGKFKDFDDNSQELLSCFVLEEDKEGLESGKDLRIPEGAYNLKYNHGSRFNATLRSEKMLNDNSACVAVLFNEKVSFDRKITIHWGNTDKDTEGCLLLGMTKSNDNSSIGSSRQACKEFYKLLKEVDISQVKLIVKNEF